MAQVSDYTGLITSEHSTRPNFMAMVGAVTGCFVDQQNFLESLPASFDLDQAIGAQLDVVGQWIGLTRNIRVPIPNAYFTWDTADIGWNQGVWKSPSDPDAGISTLDDAAYRLLLRAKIGANHWDGSTEESVAILEAIFSPEGLQSYITDNQDMSMTITVEGGQLSALTKALIDGGYIPIRPVGVSVSYVYNIYTLLFDGTFAFDGSETFDGYK